GDRAGAGQPPGAGAARRAHRQPRSSHRPGHPEPDARIELHAAHGVPGGDPRPAVGGADGSGAAPGRRPAGGRMMFRPLSIFIGSRYTRAKRRNHFISFISLTSMIGLSLGVLAMIMVLSVMNGFQREMSGRILGMV